MTFINEPPQPKIIQKQQQPVQPPNTVAVGFWADLPTYKKYQSYANKLYNQIIQDERGHEKRMLEHNDVNEFVYMAVEFFMHNLDVTEKLQKSGDLMGVVKDLMTKIGKVR